MVNGRPYGTGVHAYSCDLTSQPVVSGSSLPKTDDYLGVASLLEVPYVSCYPKTLVHTVSMFASIASCTTATTSPVCLLKALVPEGAGVAPSGSRGRGQGPLRFRFQAYRCRRAVWAFSGAHPRSPDLLSDRYPSSPNSSSTRATAARKGGKSCCSVRQTTFRSTPK